MLCSVARVAPAQFSAREPFVITARDSLASMEVRFARGVSAVVRARDSLWRNCHVRDDSTL
jgi:hypothetical protein